MKYNPADAAKACNVTVNTIRGWIRDFSEHFTPGARGESGNRLLSDKDMNTLKYIASLRLEGLQRDAIGVRLQEVTIGETETLADVPASSIAPPALPEAPHASPSSIVAPEYLLSVERRFEALEASVRDGKQGQRDYVQGIVIGAIGMLLFMLFLLLLFLLRRYL